MLRRATGTSAKHRLTVANLLAQWFTTWVGHCQFLRNGRHCKLPSQGSSPMNSKPTVMVTRKLPRAVEARLDRDFVAHLNPDDHAMSQDEILAKAEGCGGLLITPAEKFTSAAIAALPRSVRILATFSVGHDHIDLEAAKARGLTVTNTPD